MRLTILINGSDPTVNHDFALVWIDLDQKRWSRESHDGVNLPSWGEVRVAGEETALCAPQNDTPLCVMRGLSLSNAQEIQPGERNGDARWSGNGAQGEAAWQWRLQAVDRKTIRAANSLFSC
jgi:hypothetical protein